jgi:shikimate kinase
MPSDVAPPLAILLTGWPAAGKSSVGRALARRLGAALVDQDTATAPLVAVVADLVGVHDLDDERLAGPTRPARYETVAAIAEDNLRIGTPVVVVAPFTEERRNLVAWQALEHRLRSAGGSPVMVWLRLDPETAVQRLRTRGADRDLAKLSDEAAFVEALDSSEPAGPHLAVDADGPTDQMVDAILDAVLAALTPPPPNSN